jgi:hypothetical protein
MPDTLKVFANQSVAPTPTNGVLSIPLVTTDATTRAVVKDVYLKVLQPINDPLQIGQFNPKAVLMLNGVPLTEPMDARNVVLSMAGSQVVDVNSTLSLEIQPEVPSTTITRPFFPITEPFSVLLRTTAGFRVGTINRENDAAYFAAMTGQSVLNEIAAAFTVATGTDTTFYSGCTFIKNGVVNFAYTNGGTLYLLNNLGANIGVYNWPTTIYAIASDDTFIYGKSTFTEAIIYRYNHQTLAAASNLITNEVTAGYGSSNKGWVDSFDGHMYLRVTGGNGTTFKVNMTTGVVTNFLGGHAETEFIGGVINTSRLDVTNIVTFGDFSFNIQNLKTLVSTTHASVFASNPSTTYANQMISLAPGVVFVNNGQYSACAVIDTNVTPPLMTQITGTPFAMLGQTTAVMVGHRQQHLQQFPVREMPYVVHASGVEVT